MEGKEAWDEATGTARPRPACLPFCLTARQKTKQTPRRISPPRSRSRARKSETKLGVGRDDDDDGGGGGG